jgi:hypothetical protein
MGILESKHTQYLEKMSLKSFPKEILKKYEIHEWKHACAILRTDYQEEWNDIIDLLKNFKLCESWIKEAGGRKSKVAEAIDSFLYKKGWHEKKFSTSVKVDEIIMDSPTHKIDCYKHNIALEIEWNNKDPFFDRDLNNFRLLFDLRAISVGVIITRCDRLQEIFDKLGRGSSYGASTTHMSKLLPRIEGGEGAGCPILVIGITEKLYDKTC